MANTLIVTTFNKELYQNFGAECLASWIQHFPSSCQIVCYYEDSQNPAQEEEAKINSSFVRYHTFQLMPEYIKYMKDPYSPDDPLLKESGVGQYRYQAKRFSHKIFALAHAAETYTEPYIVWLDADVFCFADIPEDFFPSLFEGHYGFYLGRSSFHSECGCWGMDTRHEQHLAFIQAFLALYTTGEVYQLEQQHDSFVFDWLRRQLTYTTLSFRNLTTTVKGGHVWLASPLVQYLDHWKGKRWRIRRYPKCWQEDIDRLREQGVSVVLEHPYWKNIYRRRPIR